MTQSKTTENLLLMSKTNRGNKKCTQKGEQETLRKRGRRERKKERTNPDNKFNTKQWPLYKPLKNLKKVLWRKQQAGNILVYKNEINNSKNMSEWTDSFLNIYFFSLLANKKKIIYRSAKEFECGTWGFYFI